MYYCTCLSCETKRETSVNQNLTIWGTNSKLVISDSSILVLRNFWSRWFFRWNTILLRLFRDGGSNSCKRGSGDTSLKRLVISGIPGPIFAHCLKSEQALQGFAPPGKAPPGSAAAISGPGIFFHSLSETHIAQSLHMASAEC